MGRSRSPIRRRSRSPPPKRRSRSPRRRRSRSPPPPRGFRSGRRSRSPRRPRSRSPVRRRFSRSRSRSPDYRRERYRRSPPKNRKSPEKDGKPAATSTPISDGMSEEQMMAAMGLPTTLSTSKGKQVQGQMSGARVPSRRQYRQYMNRLGGFNRLLSNCQ